MNHIASSLNQCDPVKVILIVDDEAGISRICRDYLTRCGYAVLTAGNGLEALKLLSEKQVNVSIAILDLMMPFMDGQTLMAELQRVHPEIKCIASSGLFADDDHQMIEMLNKQGFYGVLAKPFTCETLLNMVEKHMLAPSKVRDCVQPFASTSL